MQKEKAFIDVKHQRGPSMKIKVRNLGMIHERAEIDVKPLTILIGPNNSGKTWLAYTVAALFGEYGYEHYTKLEDLSSIENAYPPLKEAIDHVLENGTATINLLQFAKEYGELYFNNIAKEAREWLGECMGTKFPIFDQLEIAVDLKGDQEQFFSNILSAKLQMNIGLGGKNAYTDSTGSGAMLSFSKEAGRQQVHLYTFSQQLLQQEIPRTIIEKHLIRSILRLLHRALYSSITILPATRATIPFLSPTPLATVQNTEEREGKTLNEQVIHYEFHTKKNSMRIPGLASDIFNYELRPRDKREREKLERSTPQMKEYSRLAHVLEETILRGTLQLPSSSQQAILFQPSTSKHPLELSMASSLVKELSSLVFYLRNFAIPGELLIIDEPEAGLHPEAQAQIIEFLAMLVNAGLCVLVTTHSPYMIDHLTNITLAATKEDQEAIRSEFFLQNTEAFIDRSRVAVYLIDHGKITDAFHDEEQDWDTFGEISNRISDIYFKL